MGVVRGGGVWCGAKVCCSRKEKGATDPGSPEKVTEDARATKRTKKVCNNAACAECEMNTLEITIISNVKFLQESAAQMAGYVHGPPASPVYKHDIVARVRAWQPRYDFRRRM